MRRSVITEAVPRKNSPLSFLPISLVDGAFSAVGEDETAFGGTRAPHWVCAIEGHATAAEPLDPERSWVRATWEALRPHAGNTGGYVNFMPEHDAERVRTSYGPAKYDRLARIKAEYDPRQPVPSQREHRTGCALTALRETGGVGHRSSGAAATARASHQASSSS